MNELILRHRFAQALVLATLILLFAGGLVTSTDSGLAVPDWPLSYGTLFPPMIGGIRYEHTHRVIAASVGFLTLFLTIWIGTRETRKWLRWLAIACFGAVVLQGILGGLTVLFLLPVAISVAHACLGPIFFSLVVSLAVLSSPESGGGAAAFPSGEKALGFKWRALTTTALVFLQIFLGALVRHTGLVPVIALHILTAFLVFIFAGVLSTYALSHFGDEKQILRPALFFGFLVIVEFFLGIAAFLFTQVAEVRSPLGSVIFPTLHQTLGSLILATGVVLTLRSRRRIE